MIKVFMRSVLTVVLLGSMLTIASAVGAQSHIRIRQCTDVVGCRADTCTDLPAPYSPAPEGACVPLSSTPALTAGNYGRFRCIGDRVGVCNPIEVFEGSPCKGEPAKVITTPVPSCAQFPPRYEYPLVVTNNEGPNGGEQYRIFTQNCGVDDTRCKSCTPTNHTTDQGLPPKYCVPHPSIPGLYFYYKDLITCSLIELDGYDTLDQCQNNPYEPLSSTTLPSQGKCWGGVSLTCIAS